MIDDRNETPSSYEIMDLGIWDREGNVEAVVSGREASG